MFLMIFIVSKFNALREKSRKDTTFFSYMQIFAAKNMYFAQKYLF